MSLEKLERRDLMNAASLLADRLMRKTVGDPAAKGDESVLLARSEFSAAILAAFDHGQAVAWNRAAGRRVCRVCGCWELHACEPGCWWVDDDLCSECETPKEDS